MQAFWQRRVSAEDDASSWQVPYADLMTLLLAVFVLISAMSELRPGKRFDAVRGGLRSALGCGTQADLATTAAVAGKRGMPTLAQRLEQAGVRELRKVDEAIAAGEEVRYEVISDHGRVIICLDGADAFPAGSWHLTGAAERTIESIGRSLAGGEAWIQIQGHAAPGEVQGDAGMRSALDIPYQRAMAAFEVLGRAGVATSRISVSLGPAATVPRGPLGAGRNLEIVVHAVPATAVNISPGRNG
jgi:flagellar motor protein MotB